MPCQFEPMNCASMVSVTSIVPSGLTTTLSPKCWITISRAGKERGTSNASKLQARAQSRVDEVPTEYGRFPKFFPARRRELDVKPPRAGAEHQWRVKRGRDACRFTILPASDQLT